MQENFEILRSKFDDSGKRFTRTQRRLFEEAERHTEIERERARSADTPRIPTDSQVKDFEQEFFSEPEVQSLPEMTSIRDLSNNVQGDETISPSCIVYPPPATGKEADFELKGPILHSLPKFHGLTNEDPHKHIKEFLWVCDGMAPRNADPMILRLKAFPFTLEDRAKTWLLDMPPGYISTWDLLKKEFLSKYFPASRVTAMRKMITGIVQGHDESFGAYYERFKRLVAACPNHGIIESNLLQYFYEGLNTMERQLLDASSGGSFVDKTPEQGKLLIENRAMNDYQFSTAAREPRHVKEAAAIPSLEARMEARFDLLMAALQEQKNVKRVCGLCQNDEHPTDQCPVLENEEAAKAMGYGGYQNQNNNGGNGGNYQRQYQPRPQYNNYPPRNPGNNYPSQVPVNANPNPSALEQVVAEQGKELSEIKKQLGQLVEFMGKITESGKLPSNTIPNPRNESAKAFTLRSGITLPDPTKKDAVLPNVAAPSASPAEAAGHAEAAPPADGLEETEPHGEDQGEAEPSRIIQAELLLEEHEQREQPDPATKVKNSYFKGSGVTNPVRPPFPGRLANQNTSAEEKEILEVFRKVEVNMPLIDCITQIPKYRKFMLELCKQRRQTRESQVAKMSENVSAVLRQRLPPKLKDPGSFSVPCMIGTSSFNNVMLDLGASINVLPSYLYARMNLGPLEKDNVIIQLADQTQTTPLGYVEDVLVRVDRLIFPADFYVIDMEEPPVQTCPILLGRPFMRTARTIIDVHAGTLSMEIEDVGKIGFKIYETSKKV